MKRAAVLLAALTGPAMLLFAQAPPPSRAVLNGPTPAAQQIARNTVQILDTQHFSRRKLDDDLARRWLYLFIKDMDGAKVYLTQADLDEIQQKAGNLADRLRNGDLTLAYDIFKKIRERQDQRLATANDLLSHPLDLNSQDEYTTDPARASFAKNDLEARELWRRRLIYELMRQKAEGFNDADAVARVRKTLEQIRTNFSQIDDDDLVEYALAALARAYDSRSSYIGPKSWRQFQDNLRSSFDGIGAQLQVRDGICRVVRILPGGAAHKDGRLKENDSIVGVAADEGPMVDVTGMKLNDIVRRIVGPKGTAVKLEVIPAGQSQKTLIALVRAPVTTQKARGAILDLPAKDGGPPLKVGYVHLPSLYGTPSGSTGQPCSEDVKAILSQGENSFQKKGVELVVLDLRTNGGGTFKEAIAVAELFLPERALIQTKAASGAAQTMTSQSKTSAWDGPLVVLTSRGSAAGTELVVAALQAHGRALIVGEATMGQGTVQGIFEASGDDKFTDPKMGVVRVTTQAFYRPNGESTQKNAVMPDVELPWLLDPPAGEAVQDYALTVDRIDPVAVNRFNFGLTEEVLSRLRAQSLARRQTSADFKLHGEVATQIRQRAAKGSVPLNFNRYQEERTAQSRLPADAVRQRKVEDAAEVERDFYFEEVLAICRDYWKELKR